MALATWGVDYIESFAANGRRGSPLPSWWSAVYGRSMPIPKTLRKLYLDIIKAEPEEWGFADAVSKNSWLKKQLAAVEKAQAKMTEEAKRPRAKRSRKK